MKYFPTNMKNNISLFAVDEIPVDEVASKVEELQQRSQTLSTLPDGLALQNKIIEIRKRIELSRNIANVVSDEICFLFFGEGAWRLLSFESSSQVFG